MEYLIYISTAKRLLDDDELINILMVSREKNERHGITGLLLYSQGTFIHFMEGPKHELDHAYSAITKDDRHKNMIKLAHGTTETPEFKEWLMGFKVSDAAKIKTIAGYICPQYWNTVTQGTHPGLDIIQTFIDSH